jgi:CheY-like chemotaxis protein
MSTNLESAGQVLVVEDDPDIQETIRDLLEARGCVVDVADDGLHALERLRGARRRTCLILLDLMMPTMNGWQFRELQLKEPDLASVPVVVLSADGSTAQRAAELGVAGYLRKPVQLDDLLATVERFCGCEVPSAPPPQEDGT